MPTWLRTLRYWTLSVGKDGFGQMGGEPSEKAGPEQDAGDHFAHDQGLVEAGDEEADDAAQGQDQADLKEEDEEWRCRACRGEL